MTDEPEPCGPARNDSAPLDRAPRLGLALACGPVDAVALAARAEQAGFDSVWATEFSWRSATVPMAAIATATDRITIGSAIAYALGRSPAMLAAEARDIDELSGGRLVLGLGSAQPARLHHWLGVDPTDVPARVAETIEAVRALWRIGPQPVRYRGRHLQVAVEATSSAYPPLRARLPLLLAAVNRRMTRVAGAVADGMIAHPIMDGPALRDLARPQLEAAAAEAGRREPPTVVAMLITVVDPDEERARRRAAAQIAFYAQHRAYAPLMRRGGFDSAAAAIRNAAGSGDWKAAVAAVPDEMTDRLAAAGPASIVRERVAQRREARDCDTLILHTPSTLMSEPAATAAGDPSRSYRQHTERLIHTFTPAAPTC